MKFIAFVFSGLLFFQTAGQSSDPCLGLLELRADSDSLLSTNVDAVLDLDQQLLGYQACLKSAKPDQLVNYLLGLMDLAFVSYQRTDYQVAVNWSSQAVDILERNWELFDTDFRENLLSEHGFYLFWKGSMEEVRSCIEKVNGPGAAFLQGLLFWTPRGTAWQQVDSLLDFSMTEKERLSPRLKSELIIWKAQNLLYSIDKRDWAEAERILLKHLQTAIKHQDRIGEIWLRYQLGSWGRTTGNEVVFAEQFRLLLTVNDLINLWPKDHPFRFRIINALAVASEGIGDMHTALLYIDEAIDHHRNEKQDLLLARRQLNKAKILRSIGRPQEAAEIYKTIIAVFKKNELNENLYSALNNLANVLSDLGETKEAITTAKDALRLKVQYKGLTNDDVAISYLNLGQIYMANDDLDSAVANWRNAEDVLLQLDRHKGVLPSVLFNSIGSAFMEQGDAGKAEYYIQKAIAALQLSKDPVVDAAVDAPNYIIAPIEMLSAQLNLARLNAKYSVESPTKLQVADSLFHLCQNLLETTRFGLVHEQSKLALQKQAVVIYDEAIRFHLSKPGLRQVDILFNLFEKSKSYALKNLVDSKTVASRYQIPDGIIAEEQELHVEIDRLKRNILDRELVGAEGADSMTSVFYKKEEDLRRLNDEIKRTYPQYYLEKYQNKSDSIQLVQNGLKKNEFVFDFHLLSNELLCVRIGSDSKRLFRFPIGKDFQADILSFLQIVSDPRRTFVEFASALQVPSFTFMSELLANIPEQSQVVIVPHQILANLPFELLLGPNTSVDFSIKRNIPYLFRNYTIRYAYSASTMGQEESMNLATGYLGAAPMCCKDSIDAEDGDVDEEFALLPYSGDEVQKASRFWPGKLLLASEATKENFIKNASSHSVLHLASHAIVDQQEPLYRSKLVFYDNHVSMTPDLYAHELYHMDLGAELVVLSACNTGIGLHQVGEGMMSLARAFRFANCPNIITSLWSVNDRSTSRMMELYFGFLEKGLGIADALSAAKIEFLETVPTESDYQLHPYYWAGFIAIGSNQSIDRKGFSSMKFVGVGSIFLLVVVSLWYWKSPLSS